MTDRRLIAWAANIAILLVGGSFTMFIAFLVAYLQNDGEGWDLEHPIFLGAVALLAGIWGLILGLLDTAILEVPARIGLGFGVLSSVTIHLAAVALGTVVSFVFAAQGSVVAGQPVVPFLALIVVCTLLAFVTARTAMKLARPTGVVS